MSALHDANPQHTIDERLDWVEPEMRALSIEETSLNPKLGGDQNAVYPDCTRS